ncbi:MAG: Holliday junction resolvase RuvX [Pseudomonadota bacterium]|nr:Holliday junction resolvase RuvX [Pseudomonadota bacterium]
MIYSSIGVLIKDLPKNTRLLGIDLGKKTMGLAVSDTNLKVATSVKTIRRTKFHEDVRILTAIINERSAGGLLIGLPISMDGTEGPACQSVRQFAINLDGLIKIKIGFWDERLSTNAVQRILIDEADLSRKRRSEVVDTMAATYILQGALDSLNAR